MAKRKASPMEYRIQVNVDASGKFNYTVNGNPGGNRIQPNLGDTISWQVTWMNLPTAFQIEFASFGPFGGTNRVLRSPFGPTTPATVALPPNYRGNLIFEYTVSIANGWSDDPDVEPVPHDGIEATMDEQQVLLSLDGSGNLVITPDHQPFTKGVINWSWDPTQYVKDDFTITFKTPEPGWPRSAQSQSDQVALNLPAAPDPVSYTIETATLGVSGDSCITVQ